MKIITIAQARDHCKTDGADDLVLTTYANAAEKACAQFANRDIFANQAAMDAALAGVSSNMAAAFTAYTNANIAAASLDIYNQEFQNDVAYVALRNSQVANSNIINGIVADELIVAAILLALGHFYRNREEVIAGSNAAALQLPIGAERIMAWYRRVGSL